ncbi:MAG: type VI secretion protein [Acidiphilium sp. 21-66-27]|nr:MAG: type VI secretion protein [Acidiphilium sp. 21-66-27]
MLKPSRRLGMACAIATLGFASPALAQVPVIDSASLAQIVISPPSSLSGNVGSLAQQYYNMNKVYIPTGSDFGSTQIQQGANETANFEAIATQNLQSLEAREQELPQIQSQLNSAKTIQQVASIQARLSAEQNYVQAQQAQAQNLQLLAFEENRAGQEAAAQENAKGEEQTLSTLCSDAQTLGGEPSACQGQ